MAKETKSPLKAAPLRVAGQSIDAQLSDVGYDEVLSPLFMAFVLVLLAGLEWYRYLSHQPPTPWAFTIAAIGAIAWAVWRVRRGFVLARRLRLGRDGERAVAQYLEWFRAKDFFVFHDVPTGDANIDHVLIGTRGLYVIETKTLSKPARGECKIVVSDGRIRANGRPLDRDPIVQAKAQARWLHNFLAESDFKNFVQPIVVFPAWFVEPFDMKALGVWVLEPKAIDGFINRQPAALSHDEVRAMSSALSSYIRSQAKL